MLTFALLIGLWSTACIQTQDMNHSGFMIETYEFVDNDDMGNTGQYYRTREWFADAACKEQYDTEKEFGVVHVGKKISGMMISGNTYEAGFDIPAGHDYGALKLEDNKLKIARGMTGSTFRNTMLSLFDYIKK